MLPTSAYAQATCSDAPVMLLNGPVDTLFLNWAKPIRDPMHECILAEFNKAKDRVRSVILNLSSGGGSLKAAENAIAVLKTIRATHRLDTMVSRGAICGSACVPIFLAGERRYGALTSSWLFHEVGRSNAKNGWKVISDRAKTERVLQDYFLAAGVSEAWLNQLRPRIQHSDYWQTGQNLIDDKSGIITHPLDNLTPRRTEQK